MDTIPDSRQWRPSTYAGYIAGWTLLGLWLGINSLLGHRHQMPRLAAWEPITWELSSTLVLGVLALLVARFETLVPIGRRHSIRHLPAHVLAAILFSLLHVSGMVALRKALYLLMGRTYVFGGLVPLFYEMQKDLIGYALIIGACVLLRYSRERHQRELDTLRLSQALGHARLAQLGAQLEPHFLFNALNTIACRMHEDVDAADRLLVSLSSLLRAVIVDSGDHYAPVWRELEWLRSYCELMGQRQPGRLHILIDIDDEAPTARMPRLILQPLVENAFRHGLADGHGHLHIVISCKSGTLICTIRDDGTGYHAGKLGFGIRNVRERLRLLYGDRARFDITRLEGSGTEARLMLPWEPADA